MATYFNTLQVTPGANTHLDPYRGTEGALLTPLTISSGGSPENGTNDLVSRYPQDNHITSNSVSTPTSLLSERYLMESPKSRTDAIIFNLDSPVIPDHISSPEEPYSEREHNNGGIRSQVQISASSSEHLWNSAHSPIPSSPTIDNKLFWLTSNGATPKGEFILYIHVFMAAILCERSRLDPQPRRPFLMA